jgi:serine protease Do
MIEASSFRQSNSVISLQRLFFAVTLALAVYAPAAQAQQEVVPQSRAEVELTFAPIVRQAAPAVVNIYTRRVVESRVSPFLNDPFFQRFFGEDFFGRPAQRIQNSLGSGVIVEPDGLIVTNYHVIKDSDEITVALADRREFAARIVGGDERTDLALLRIDAPGEPLPTLQLRDSDELEVGDLVLAIGNPFGVGQTVTMGIVSAVARTRVGIGDLGYFIQTDAAINPGNSGGALVTMDGRLVGINTAIYSRDGGSVGIGFAIPANMVKTVIAAEKNGGKLVRPWIGATGQPVTQDLAEGLGLERPSGVIINGVYPGGPAAEAGLDVGDVVIAVNGREVDDPEALRFRLATLPIGGTADVTVLRDGQERHLAVPLVAAPEMPPRNETLIGGRNPLSGATVANLSPALAEELSLNGAWQGIIILAMERGAIAARAGLRPGDVLLEINGEAVAEVGDLVEALDRATDRWEITFRREGRVRTIVIS